MSSKSLSYQRKDISHFLLCVLFCLICLKVFFWIGLTGRSIIDYIIYGLSCLIFILKKTRKPYSKYEKKISVPFIFLISLMIVGLIQNVTFFSLTSVFSIICVYCLVISLIDVEMFSEIICVRVGFISVLLFLSVKTAKEVNLGNTITGFLVFFSVLYIVVEKCSSRKQKKTVSVLSFNDIYELCVYGITFLICWKSHARTAALTLLVILFIYFLLNVVTFSTRFYLFVYWLLITLLLAITYFYAYIHSFSWFNQVDALSMKYFNKSLDTSRPELWRSGFENLKWWQFLIGKGTGILPQIERYKDSSFHNSYLQLLVQNGLLGLSCLVWIFWIIWKTLVAKKDDKVIKLVISTFFGMLVYNCFETTLLQNKIFLGITEWFILGIGVSRVFILFQEDNTCLY